MSHHQQQIIHPESPPSSEKDLEQSMKATRLNQCSGKGKCPEGTCTPCTESESRQKNEHDLSSNTSHNRGSFADTYRSHVDDDDEVHNFHSPAIRNRRYKNIVGSSRDALRVPAHGQGYAYLRELYYPEEKTRVLDALRPLCRRDSLIRRRHEKGLTLRERYSQGETGNNPTPSENPQKKVKFAATSPEIIGLGGPWCENPAVEIHDELRRGGMGYGYSSGRGLGTEVKDFGAHLQEPDEYQSRNPLLSSQRRQPYPIQQHRPCRCGRCFPSRGFAGQQSSGKQSPAPRDPRRQYSGPRDDRPQYPGERDDRPQFPGERDDRPQFSSHRNYRPQHPGAKDHPVLETYAQRHARYQASRQAQSSPQESGRQDPGPRPSGLRRPGQGISNQENSSQESSGQGSSSRKQVHGLAVDSDDNDQPAFLGSRRLGKLCSKLVEPPKEPWIAKHRRRRS